MDRDLIGIFKIDKSMYKSMFTKILPNPVQVLGYFGDSLLESIK